MLVSFGQTFTSDVAELRQSGAPFVATHTVHTAYGADRRGPNFIVIGLIGTIHVLGLAAFILFDVLPKSHKVAPPLQVVLVPTQIMEPPQPPAPVVPPSRQRAAPHSPAPLVATTTPTSQALNPILVSPPATTTPAPSAPVAAPSAPVAAPPAPPAPIVPPNANASTLNNRPPAYPIESRRHHEQGTVRLRVVITTGGVVKEISVIQSSGFDRLDRAALDAVRGWRFAPGTQAGVAVEAVGSLSIPFRLT